MKNLQKLARDNMIDGFDFNASSDLTFCEMYVGGKHHRSQFPKGTSTRSNEPLGLVHSDVCGKLNTKSLGGVEYFLTIIDDNAVRLGLLLEAQGRSVSTVCGMESSSRKVKWSRSENSSYR